MKKSVFALSALFAVSLAATVFAQEFSADMVMTQKGVTTSAKVFMSGQKSRMEAPGSISISRMDKKVMWILMPEQKMYMEQAFDPSKMMVSSGKIEGELERTPLGKDTVDGRVTDKYKVTYEIQGMRNEMYQWIESGSNFPLKTASLDDSWSAEYRNIKTGPQPDSLFEVPAGYKKFSMDMPDMGEMMKKMEKND
jgi:hypothetical protein